METQENPASEVPSKGALRSPQFVDSDPTITNGINRRNTTATRRGSGSGPALRRDATRGSTLSRVATSLFRPEHNVGNAPPFWKGLKSIILSSWFNVLLVFIPVSWALNFAKPDSHTVIFVTAFLAIIPLAKLLAFATEELSMRTGQTIAGLLNATLGNAVELIVAIIALTKCQLQIVQSSLVGSILSNLLLVLGMCFFAGGTRFSEQGFGISASQINSSLLALAVIAVLLPAAFDSAVRSGTSPNGNSTSKLDEDFQMDILHLSHGIAIILLLIYVAYIVFQLWTHTHLYEDSGEEVAISKKYDLHHKARPSDNAAGASSSTNPTLNDAENGNGHVNGNGAAATTEKQEEEVEQPQTSLLLAIVLLVVVTVLVAVTAEFLVDSVDGLTENGGISKEFVGIILLAIVGNAAEHVTAVTVSVKDKLTLSIGVAVGSSIQIALFVIPFIVTLGWIIGKPLTMLFDPLESVVLFFAVLVTNYVVADGKSNWLEGAILFFLYVICAIIFWYYPGTDPSVRYADLKC